MAFFKRFKNQEQNGDNVAALAEDVAGVSTVPVSSSGEKPEAERVIKPAPEHMPPVDGSAQPQEQAQEGTRRRRGKRFGGVKGGVLDPVLSFGIDEQPAVQPVAPQPKKKKNAVEAEMDSLSSIFGESAPKASVPLPSEEAGEHRVRLDEAEFAAALPSDGESERAETGNAPVVEPMKSLRRAKREKKAKRPRPENPVSLAFADLSDRTDLTAEEIEDASDIYGIKYPANFDTSTCDYEGRAIDFSNFSLCTALKWEHIELASDISGIVFPASFDIENADFYNRSIRSCDFSAVYAMKWKHIAAAADIVAVKYPPTFDIADANFAARNISSSDFSLVSSMRWEHIAQADNITGIKFPSTFNIDSADFAGRDISKCDFSLVATLSWDHIAGASNVRGIIYPAQFSFEGVSFAGMDISGSDFSRCTSFDFEAIREASSISGVRYPDCFDADTSDYSGRDIHGSNFSRVATLRWRHIENASDIRKLVYPPQFDIDTANFESRDIDFSDFSLLPGFNWDSAIFADSREGVVYPAGFVEPQPSVDDVQGAMLLFLLKLYTREYKGELDTARFYADISALYPGVDDERATVLIEHATRLWEQEDGKKRTALIARNAHIGDKLYLVKLGFKLCYPIEGMEKTLEMLRENFAKIFKSREMPKFEQRLTDLSRGKYLSAKELESIGFVPVSEHKDARSVVVEEPAKTPAQPAVQTEPKREEELPRPERAVEPQQTPQVERPRVYTFGQVLASDVEIDDTPLYIPDEPELVNDTDDEGSAEETPIPLKPQREEVPEAVIDDDIIKPVDLTALRKEQEAQAARRAKAQLTDEEKGIRTGVMGMLIYIHKSVSDEELSQSELFTQFMKIYPGASAKEVAAMAQFAQRTLEGRNTDIRAKLFLFASHAPTEVKHKLLDYTYSKYIYRLSETADEDIFREFMLALCNTLFDDSPEYEYSNFLYRRDILKKPLPDREASYKRIAFDANIGKANLYANDRYPFYRTLEQLGFSHFTFEAIKGSLLIEVSDSRAYEELGRLVYREKNPHLMQFVVIDTTMGLLYLEKRALDDWGINEETVWRTAERNMQNQEMAARYSFSSNEYTSFRYVQHDLASYILTNPRMLEKLAKGKDIILSAPCREIVYIDTYNFSAVKHLLEFSSRYNCTLLIGGEEYEHPITPDVFIYHADDRTIERVNDESYILLGDSVARREVLHTVLPLNVEVNIDKLQNPGATDEVELMSDESVTVQEAAYTILRLYCEMNGERDYTLPYNACMGIFDEISFASDATYPPARGREQPDPMEHIDTAAKYVMRAGKTVCWLLVQALQRLCGDAKYETPTSAGIRKTVLDTIYGDNANAVWLNCATATEYNRKFEATARLHERMVENQHLTILDSRVEVLMHALTLMFHQFGRKYALSQVRRHMLYAMPDVIFDFEINQSAWLPAPGDDVDLELQSQGMILRGFDRITQDGILTSLAEAIGDRDLAEGGWPLLIFIKLVKYAYLDPAEMVEKFFISRSRLIPSQAVLKQLYYKEVNNEFIKHNRKNARNAAPSNEDIFEERASSEPELPGTFETVLSYDASPAEGYSTDTERKPDFQFRQVEPGYLEKRMSVVLEPIDRRMVTQLKEAAHFVTKVFHVPEMMFKSNNDLEAELHYGILRHRVQITTLRSMAWTLYNLLLETGRDMKDVTEADIARAVEIVEINNRLNYKTGGAFECICAMPLDEGMFVPVSTQLLSFAQELMPEFKLISLFSLQEELIALAPSIKLCYDMLRLQKRGEIMPPEGVLFDTLCAWSALAFSCGDAFELTDGPGIYTFNQIQR